MPLDRDTLYTPIMTMVMEMKCEKCARMKHRTEEKRLK